MNDNARLYRDDDGEFRWVRTSANGDVVGAATEGYSRKDRRPRELPTRQPGPGRAGARGRGRVRAVIELFDIERHESWWGLEEAQREAVLDWQRLVGIDDLGFTEALVLLEEGQVAVRFLTDERYVPTRDAEAILVRPIPCAAHEEATYACRDCAPLVSHDPEEKPHPTMDYEVGRIWATVDVEEPPPVPQLVEAAS